MDTIVYSQSLDGFISNCKNYRKKSFTKEKFILIFFLKIMIRFIDFISFYSNQT